MTTAFIEDGATRRGYVAEVEGLHPSCVFTYRPMQAIELSHFLARSATCDEEGLRRESAKELSARLKTWDLKAAEGSVPFNEHWLLRLQPRLYKRIQDIVFGFEPGDREQRAASLGNCEAGSSSPSSTPK